LQIVSWRFASSKRSIPGIGPRIPAGKFAEYRVDRQAETAHVSFVEDISWHDFSCGMNVIEGMPAIVEEKIHLIVFCEGALSTASRHCFFRHMAAGSVSFPIAKRCSSFACRKKR
jgi:hypothetical protein